ncbi:aspartate racemase [Photobacterium aquae]|uniref:Aspartate racemase n=1 Tax=Photobacterium aquae TaxID=1195763 RepID=A0A0J1JXD4_9GAMM|nr:aspartate/glutamate racemase family protein [Photobacterium aquae]KLV06952.1 aspartate racemase [Photobacterium aquae]
MGATHSPRIGIIGGLGNEAMVDLLKKIQTVTHDTPPAFIAFGNSRLAYKPEEVGKHWQPEDLPEQRRVDTARYTLRLMQHLGVDSLGLACNSAHSLFRELLQDIPLPFVDMLKQTATTLEGTSSNVLVMGVDSLIHSGLYQSALTEKGVTSTSPNPENQKKVMAAIYDPEFGIKTAKITEQAERLLCEVITDECTRQQCKLVVLGCTELPLALTSESCQRFKQNGWIPQNIDVIDASSVLAQALVDAISPQNSENEGNGLAQPLSLFAGNNLDWFPPLTFKVNSLEQAIDIQQAIFDSCCDYLAKQGKGITGSYWHLPTLFFSQTETDIEQSLSELGITAHSGDCQLSELVDNVLPAFYS